MSTPKLPSEIEIRVCWGDLRTKRIETEQLRSSHVDPDLFYMINLGWPTTWGVKHYYCWRKKE